MGLKSIASRIEEVVPIYAISKLIMEPVKKGCKGGEVGNLSPLTVGGGGNPKHHLPRSDSDRGRLLLRISPGLRQG